MSETQLRVAILLLGSSCIRVGDTTELGPIRKERRDGQAAVNLNLFANPPTPPSEIWLLIFKFWQGAARHGVSPLGHGPDVQSRPRAGDRTSVGTGRWRSDRRAGVAIECLEGAESETTNIPRLERALVLCAVCEMGPQWRKQGAGQSQGL